MNAEGNAGYTAFMDTFYTDDGESFDSTDLTKGTVNGYQFYMEGQSGARFSIEVVLKVQATTKENKTTKCFETSMNDYLGTVYVHNAMNLKIDLDDFIGFVSFNNGEKDLQISAKDISYVMEGNNKQVLKIAQ